VEKQTELLVEVIGLAQDISERNLTPWELMAGRTTGPTVL
jgi:hypothetical protein